MYRRINVTLPEETVWLLDRVRETTSRSRLINAAIRRYIRQSGRKDLRRRLQEGYQRSAQSDLRLAAEWSLLEQ